ncbi:hypothetical protein WA538_003136 [Blastocystis sp. DL]
MGLGKTITLLSLLLLSGTQPREKVEGKQGGTLIVCPLSLVFLWRREILSHILPGALSACAFHNGRFSDVWDETRRVGSAEGFRVVITTYDSCVAAFNHFSTSFLFNSTWKRIVLDEGHVIKNDKTLVHKAIMAIPAEIHWVLSGTPIQNTVDDLFALFRFLRFSPWNSRHVWDILLSRDSKKKESKPSETRNDIHINTEINTTTDLQRLRYPLSLVMLRRTYRSRDSRGNPIISLPSKIVTICALSFSPTERRFYDELLRRTQTVFQDFLMQGVVKRQYATILSLLLAVRQACDHPFLLLRRAKRVLKRQREEELQRALTEEMIGRIYEVAFRGENPVTQYAESVMKQLQEGGEAFQCPICGDELGLHPVFTSCLHAFCENCVSHMVHQSGYPFRCPTCRKLNEKKDLLRVDIPTLEYKPVVFDPQTQWHSSTKIDAFLTQLDTIWKCFRDDAMAAQEKFGNILVFSQWVAMLDLIGIALEKHGYKFEKFTGDMTKQQRDTVLTEFEGRREEGGEEKRRRVEETPFPKILLISLRAGGVGLNLTSANTVFMMDPWWNEAVENQAINRAFRIGQKRKVTVYRLIIKDSIEEKILKLQEKKEQLIQSTLDYQSSTTIKLTIDEIAELLR